MGPFTQNSVPKTPQIFNVLHDDGTSWDLSVYSSIIGSITMPDGTDVVIALPNVQTIAGNQIMVKWVTPSLFTQIGEYRLQFKMTASDGSIDYTKVVDFTVEPASVNDDTIYWCTLNDVLQITGQSATEEQLAQAQMIIDIYSHRTTAQLGRIKPRDLKWLMRALAYQTIWQAAQPDFLTKTGFESVSQDGFSGRLFNKSGNNLGPLAEKALKNCSWLRTRSLRPKTPFTDGDYDMELNPLGNDSILDWQPI